MTITTFIFLAIGAILSWGWYNHLKDQVEDILKDDSKAIEEKAAIAMCTGMVAMGVPLFLFFYIFGPISWL